VVKFTSAWTQYPIYENKANMSSLLQSDGKHFITATHDLQNKAKHYFVLKSDRNTTSLSQFIMQLKIRPDIIVVE